jgi:hypothetical protein
VDKLLLAYDSREGRQWAEDVVNGAGKRASIEARDFRDLYLHREVLLAALLRAEVVIFVLSEDSHFSPDLSPEAGDQFIADLRGSGKTISLHVLNGKDIPQFLWPLQAQPVLPQSLVERLLKMRDRAPHPDPVIIFDPELSERQILGTLTALANYFRGCGGIGLPADVEIEKATTSPEVYA